ncbi:MAG: hypothetical protein JTT16_01355, partial [Candidatus Brockarchaeota archaeon]|nr:hypothetical protein [Candidatus Brockarchaeota archaeon]
MVKSIVVSTARLPKTLVEKLKIYAEYFYLDETLNKEEILSNAEVLITWGQDFDYKEIRKMKKLKAIQTLSAGVDHVPFKEIPDSVLLYSNAGAYSEQCGEFAWALILAFAGCVVAMSSTVVMIRLYERQGDLGSTASVLA